MKSIMYLSPLIALAAIACFSQASRFQKSPQYSVRPIGPDCKLYGQGTGINDKGQVCGWVSGGGDNSSFVADGGKVTKIEPAGERYAVQATSIAPDGAVAGSLSRPEMESRAFIYRDGKQTELDPLPGFKYSSASSANAKGEVVGYCGNFSPPSMAACLWKDGKATALPTLSAEDSVAIAINSKGQIVGVSTDDKKVRRAILWENGQLRDLGILPGGTRAEAQAINDAGDIVGVSTIDDKNNPHPFLYKDGKMTDLGLVAGPGASANAISSDGRIAGHEFLKDGKLRAWVRIDGKLTDLNSVIPKDSGWTLVMAKGINKDGTIIGVGEKDGILRPFLAVPSKD